MHKTSITVKVILIQINHSTNTGTVDLNVILLNSVINWEIIWSLQHCSSCLCKKNSCTQL